MMKRTTAGGLVSVLVLMACSAHAAVFEVAANDEGTLTDLTVSAYTGASVAAGGTLYLDLSAAPPFAITGAGRVVKTGAGEIVLAKGLQLGSAGVTNDSGLVTANWTGLTEVREGKLTICGGAARSDLAVQVYENAVLDLDGAAVKIGRVSGKGRIVNGTLSCTIAIPFGTPEYELAALGDTAVGRVTVDFGATGGQKVEIGTVLPVAKWSGAVPFDAGQWRGVNLGDGVRAQFALVDGTVYATAVQPYGALMIFR